MVTLWGSWEAQQGSVQHRALCGAQLQLHRAPPTSSARQRPQRWQSAAARSPPAFLEERRQGGKVCCLHLLQLVFCNDSPHLPPSARCPPQAHLHSRSAVSPPVSLLFSHRPLKLISSCACRVSSCSDICLTTITGDTFSSLRELLWNPSVPSRRGKGLLGRKPKLHQEIVSNANYSHFQRTLPSVSRAPSADPAFGK